MNVISGCLFPRDKRYNTANLHVRYAHKRISEVIYICTYEYCGKILLLTMLDVYYAKNDYKYEMWTINYYCKIDLCT